LAWAKAPAAGRMVAFMADSWVDGAPGIGHGIHSIGPY